jgi:GNAT superfamily N-acetyltransferase
MELTRTVVPVMVVQPQISTAWTDVVAEITASCVRRASVDSLWCRPGAVGVLRGPAPVMWVHGRTDAAELTGELSTAPDVREVYVEAGQTDTVAALVAQGWAVSEVVSHLVHEGAATAAVPEGLPAITPLQPTDLPDVRDLLYRHGGVDEEQLAAFYGDDFVLVAAPVWMFGARDKDGRLVAVVAVRRQGRGAMGFALTVDPDWRSSGLSTALVSAAVDHAMLVGAAFVHAQAGLRSRGCLRAVGFVEAGTWQRLTRA